MSIATPRLLDEPIIAVGLVDGRASAKIFLEGTYRDGAGRVVPAGELQASCRDGAVRCEGVWIGEGSELALVPSDLQTCRFSLEAIIGIDFHWQQRERQSFRGELRLVRQADDRLAVVNRVPLESYLASVVCSEMKASSPPEFIKAHAVISRSWLLAQLASCGGLREGGSPHFAGSQVAWDAPRSKMGTVPDAFRTDSERVRWTDRQSHDDFDVCADDHCQRYQGIERIDSPGVAAAVGQTRGQVLVYDGQPCDARYSKCCGGVMEEFATAWGDVAVPYLVSLGDWGGASRQPPRLLDDEAMRSFLHAPPAAYCNCGDKSILGSVLNDYDLATENFFRWQTRLTADEATDLVRRKLGIDLGRLVRLEPVERGPSGRLKRLRLIGERQSLVIGKELEIRRALSETHLYSSALVVDVEGSPERPDAFMLTGGGWGHGVGLCQIGAAVMAHQGAGYREILAHYYPGAEVSDLYR